MTNWVNTSSLCNLWQIEWTLLTCRMHHKLSNPFQPPQSVINWVNILGPQNAWWIEWSVLVRGICYELSKPFRPVECVMNYELSISFQPVRSVTNWAYPFRKTKNKSLSAFAVGKHSWMSVFFFCYWKVIEIPIKNCETISFFEILWDSLQNSSLNIPRTMDKFL